ncbi:MAG: ester cyclase [Saprospiraceae bacterium]|nr:ester cyclase [Saprospiraceae bacterium]
MKFTTIFSALFFMMSITPAFSSSLIYPTPTDIVQQYFVAIDAGDSKTLSELLSDDLMAWAPFSPQPMPKQAWLSVGQGFKTSFPDMKHEIVQFIESGNTVAVRGVFSGQNNGAIMGNPPTGNRVSCPFNTIVELDNSWKIKKVYVQFDQKNYEAQLMAGLTNGQAIAEATVRGIMQSADASNTEQLLSYFDTGAKHYFGGMLNTNEELSARVKALKAGFPDIKRDLKVIAYADGLITVQGWLTGTHTGNFMGMAPTGNKIKISALGVYKINKAGKVTEAWVELDSGSLANQLQGGLTTGKK